MRALLQHHHRTTAAQLVDSALPSTRAFWRAQAGSEKFADDPRPLADCIAPLYDRLE